MDFDNGKRNDDVFSKVVRAGKRTYFIDIKTTKANELYLTLTESKKVGTEGNENFQKHKIFLYKEDIENFRDGLDEVFEKLEELNKSGNYTEGQAFNKHSEVSFDDLN
jgi:hypothetical protein